MVTKSSLAFALLLTSTAALGQERLSDYMTRAYEDNCLKQDISACSQLIYAAGVPKATRARALAIRGAARLREDALEDAKADLKGAIDIAGASPDPTMAKLDALRGIPELTSEWHSAAHAKFADVLLRSDDKPGALAEVEKAIKLDAGNGPAYAVRARVFGAEQKWAPALADFDKALALGLDDASERALTHYRRGIVRSMVRQPADAQLLDLDSAIAADPTLAIAYGRRGALYRDMGRYEDALRDYDALVARAPQYADGYNSACWVRAAYLKREFDKARAYCDRALELDPKPDTYDSAGLVALQQQRWQDAWSFYDKAAQGDPKMASAHYGRGIAAKRLGRNAEGAADIATAVRMDPQVTTTFSSYGQDP